MHILHGEFLEGAGRDEEARAAFCRSYVASGAAAAAALAAQSNPNPSPSPSPSPSPNPSPNLNQAHAAQFVRDAWAALNQPAGPDLHSAEQYFGMALCIEPGLVVCK